METGKFNRGTGKRTETYCAATTIFCYTELGNTAGNKFIEIYYFTDLHPLTATGFYRIRLMDASGYYFSNIVAVQQQTAPISIFPNPAKDILYVQAGGLTAATAIVHDLSGKQIIVYKIPANGN